MGRLVRSFIFLTLLWGQAGTSYAQDRCAEFSESLSKSDTINILTPVIFTIEEQLFPPKATDAQEFGNESISTNSELMAELPVNEISTATVTRGHAILVSYGGYAFTAAHVIDLCVNDAPARRRKCVLRSSRNEFVDFQVVARGASLGQTSPGGNVANEDWALLKLVELPPKVGELGKGTYGRCRVTFDGIGLNIMSRRPDDLLQFRLEGENSLFSARQFSNFDRVPRGFSGSPAFVRTDHDVETLKRPALFAGIFANKRYGREFISESSKRSLDAFFDVAVFALNAEIDRICKVKVREDLDLQRCWNEANSSNDRNELREARTNLLDIQYTENRFTTDVGYKRSNATQGFLSSAELEDEICEAIRGALNEPLCNHGASQFGEFAEQFQEDGFLRNLAAERTSQIKSALEKILNAIPSTSGFALVEYPRAEGEVLYLSEIHQEKKKLLSGLFSLSKDECSRKNILVNCYNNLWYVAMEAMLYESFSFSQEAADGWTFSFSYAEEIEEIFSPIESSDQQNRASLCSLPIDLIETSKDFGPGSKEFEDSFGRDFENIDSHTLSMLFFELYFKRISPFTTNRASLPIQTCTPEYRLAIEYRIVAELAARNEIEIYVRTRAAAERLLIRLLSNFNEYADYDIPFSRPNSEQMPSVLFPRIDRPEYFSTGEEIRSWHSVILDELRGTKH